MMCSILYFWSNHACHLFPAKTSYFQTTGCCFLATCLTRSSSSHLPWPLMCFTTSLNSRQSLSTAKLAPRATQFSLASVQVNGSVTNEKQVRSKNSKPSGQVGCWAEAKPDWVIWLFYFAHVDHRRYIKKFDWCKLIPPNIITFAFWIFWTALWLIIFFLSPTGSSRC